MSLKQELFTKLGATHTAIILIMLKEINNLRAEHGQPAITKLQALQLVVNKAEDINGTWDALWDTEFDE